jgi:hypothetical protein
MLSYKFRLYPTKEQVGGTPGSYMPAERDCNAVKEAGASPRLKTRVVHCLLGGKKVKDEEV